MPIDTAAIRALADAATEGPWTSYGHDGAYVIARVLGLCNTAPPHMTAQHYHDALFAPAARNNILALCDELDALREQLEVACHTCECSPADACHFAAERDALRAKIAKLREYVGGPLVPTGDPAYDNGRDTVRCELLAILDEVNNA